MKKTLAALKAAYKNKGVIIERCGEEVYISDGCFILLATANFNLEGVGGMPAEDGVYIQNKSGRSPFERSLLPKTLFNNLAKTATDDASETGWTLEQSMLPRYKQWGGSSLAALYTEKGFVFVYRHALDVSDELHANVSLLAGFNGVVAFDGQLVRKTPLLAMHSIKQDALSFLDYTLTAKERVCP